MKQINCSSRYLFTSSILVTLYSILLSCGYRKTNNIQSNNYEFRKLEISRTNSKGYRKWRVESPKASYDNIEDMIKANTADLTLYKDGNEYFNINGAKLQIHNKDNLIIFDDDVRINKYNSSNQIVGKRLTWNTEQNIVSIYTNVKLSSDSIELNTDKISYNILNNQATFLGNSTILLGLTNPADKNSTTIEVKLDSGLINIQSGELTSKSTNLINIQNESNNSTQQITSKSLIGNIYDGFLTLEECTYVTEATITTTADICTIRTNFNKSNGRNNLDDNSINKVYGKTIFIKKDSKVRSRIKI